jgi:hypothetical protein
MADNPQSIEVVSGQMVQGVVTVGTTAVEAKVGGSPLAGRMAVRLFNKGPRTVFMGPTSGVTTATGEPLYKDQMTSFPIGPASTLWLVADQAGQSVIVWEAPE